MSSLPLRIRCREIGTADIDGIVDLLTTGFRIRPRDFWVRAFRRLSDHSTPPGFPKYGYLLERNGIPVGAILLIFSTIVVDGTAKTRCSVSSWYVEPAVRSYAAMLASRALKHKQVTYFNITSHPSTVPILEAQGYVRYCTGRFVAVPAISRWSHGSYVRVTGPNDGDHADLPSHEIELLVNHANYGCISVTCGLATHKHPFVFLPLRQTGVAPYAYLAYCRRLEDFIRFSGPLGRFLIRRGIPLVVVDSNGPIDGLAGRYFDGAPKYSRGPDPPRLGDLAYSERVMFGF